ncbi:MAG: flagellar basal body rod protein FlgF [Chromatiales bacterium]|nr:flagellar basal body rod protein FlgF [Chromatiales bacterium]
MDRLLYVAMTGARAAQRAQAITSHNLANVSTTGFRAVRESMVAQPVAGEGQPTRVLAVSGQAGWDARQGPVIETGRSLDVAIQGPGWLAVQAPDGSEAYTRNGNLRVTPDGLLETANGHLVLGNGGPVSLPPFESLFIGNDGQISIVPLGQPAESQVVVDRLRLVDPDPQALSADGQGLYRLPDGEEALPDPAVRVASGQLESSNVNVAETLVRMIELARSYEMQVRAMHTAEQNDAAAAQLMRLGG